MEHKEYLWKSHDKLPLYAQSWKPSEKNGNLLLLVHGLGEHGGRYKHWASRFNAKGYTVLAMDLRGHGKSGGKRGYAPNYESVMKDFDLLFQKTEELFPSENLFLYGHSLGGNLVAAYTLKRNPRIKALVASSPWIKICKQPSTWLVFLIRRIARIYPGLVSKSKFNPDFISHDPAVVQEYNDDPLIHDKIGIRFLFNVHHAARFIMANKHKFNIPFLLMHGTGDELTSFEGSEELASNSSNITFKPWDGLFHELHNEPEKEEIFSYIMNWFEKINSNGQVQDRN